MNMQMRLAMSMSVLALNGCMFTCENEIFDTAPSPSGALSAVSFSRNCGTATGYNVQVSILESGHSPRDGGNAMVVDQVFDGSASLTLRWIDDRSLEITVPRQARFFTKNESVGDVRITYR